MTSMHGIVRLTLTLVVASILQGMWGAPSFATDLEKAAGKIAGKVLESETGQPLIGATVIIEETNQEQRSLLTAAMPS